MSGDSDYDSNLLNEKEENGKELFFSDELACSSCHGTFLLQIRPLKIMDYMKFIKIQENIV